MPPQTQQRRFAAVVAYTAPGVSLPRRSAEQVFAAGLDFWRRTTGDQLIVEATRFFGDITLTINPPAGGFTNDYLAGTDFAMDLVKQARNLVSKTLERNETLEHYDGGLVVFCHPGTFPVPGSPATTDVGFRAAGWNRFGLAMPSAWQGTTISVLAHELGHCLGFDHPYGVAADLSRSSEYGSPFDIMGFGSFARSPAGAPIAWLARPTYALPVADWATTIADGWSVNIGQVGPNLSRAQIAFKWPESITRIVEPDPEPGATNRYLLRAPTDASPGNVLIFSPNDRADQMDRVFVEYRPGRGLDTGLALDPTDPDDDAQEGIVVHQVDYATDARGPRLFFRGSLRRQSSDTDVNIPRAGSLRVLRWTDYWAEVEVGPTPVPRCEVHVVREDGRLGRPAITRTERTECGDEYQYGTFPTSLVAEYAAAVTGLGGAGPFYDRPPNLRWQVGGVNVPTAPGRRPVAFAVDGKTYTVLASITERETLILETAEGDAYDVEVRAWIDDPVTYTERAARLKPDGSYTGPDMRGIALMAQCAKKSVPIDPGVLVFDPNPDPVDQRVINPRLARLRERWVDRRLEQIELLPGLTEKQRSFARNVVLAQQRQVSTFVRDVRQPAPPS